MGIRSRIRGSLERLIDERLRLQVDEVRRDILQSEIRARRDLKYAAEADAVRSSSVFVQESMTEAIAFWDPIATLEASLAAAPRGGLALEFGVFEGTTLRVISAARRGAVVGFDSFEGLPETWREGFRQGAFTTDVPEIAGASLVAGWFDETLAPFLERTPGVVDFLHVDCDLYSSTVTVLDLVGPRLAVGSIIQFDEYFNYPGWQRGEYLAWKEFTERTGIGWQYLYYTGDNEQVSVRITRTRTYP